MFHNISCPGPYDFMTGTSSQPWAKKQANKIKKLEKQIYELKEMLSIAIRKEG